MNDDTLLSIGDLAEATGVSVSALRYWHENELIATAARVGGKRRFAPTTAGRVNFIRRAQRAGFTHDEIRTLLRDEAGAWRSHVTQKLVELRSKRTELDEMIGMLEEVQTCGCTVVADCPRAPSS